MPVPMILTLIAAVTLRFVSGRNEQGRPSEMSARQFVSQFRSAAWFISG